jgi:DNA polymerase-1
MTQEPRTLYLIDISSYFYRAFHAIRGLSTSKGLPTNAAYGVTNMLLKVIKERRPHYLALVFDSKGPTQRHRDFPDYKAQRPGMPEELVMQLPYINKIIEGFRLPALRQEGFEADDLICTLVQQARQRGFRVEIISGDKDLLPLVQEGVDMWDPMKEVRYDPAAIREKYGLTPEELIEVRALAGDVSDNIPGVPGIGEKTAIKLIAEYHSLENLLARVNEIKQKALREKLTEYAEQARLSRRLTVLECAVPLQVDLEALQPGPPDREGLRRLFVELEFNKLVKELGFDTRPPETCLLIRSREALERLAADLRAGGRLSLVFLTGEQHPVMAPLAGTALAWQTGAAAYAPFDSELPAEAAWQVLGPLWSDPAVAKVGADLKAAMLIAGRFGVEPANLAGDVLLASYLLDPARYEQNLENVALHYLGLNLAGPRELAGRPLGTMDLPPDLGCVYGASRAEAALNLWPLLQEELEREGLWELYANLELPLLAVLARMEALGIGLDQEFLRRFGQDLEEAMQRLEQEIYQLAGEAFLINSPQQLGRILFEKLHLTPQKKTKGKALSTDVEVLQTLAALHPLPAKILEYRTMGKIKSTNVEALLKLVNPATGRIHTTFQQSVAATGRLSSRDPNLQNIPVRGSLGGQVRQAFIPAPDHVFLGADYSQMELRLLAHFSADPLLLRAFREGVDIHRQTAAEVFGIHPELVSPEMRRQAKVVNFGIIYGISAFGLAKQMGVAQRVAGDFIQRYFSRHTRVQAYLDETLQTARERGWVATLLGRRRRLPNLTSANRILRQEAERAATNTPLQGTAADIIKKAMLEVEHALAAAGLTGRMLLQIHDELLFEVPESEVAATARVVRRIMQEAVILQVPLAVDLRAGKNWGEMTPYEKKVD